MIRCAIVSPGRPVATEEVVTVGRAWIAVEPSVQSVPIDLQTAVITSWPARAPTSQRHPTTRRDGSSFGRAARRLHRRRCAAGGKYRRACRIADAQLKVPALRPVLGLLVLADLEQNHILTLPQRRTHFVLVHAHPAVVFFAGEDELAVEPELPGVGRPQPQLHRTRLVALKFGSGIGDSALEGPERFGQVHDSVLLIGLVLDPADSL